MLKFIPMFLSFWFGQFSQSTLTSIGFAVSASTACLCGKDNNQTSGLAVFPTLDAIEILRRELVCGFEAQGLAEMAQGIVELPFQGQQHAQVQMGLGVGR